MPFEPPATDTIAELNVDRWPPIVSRSGSSTLGGPIVIDRYEPTEPWRWPPHWHNSHQLLWAPTGTLHVEAEQRSWLLPPTLALWVPVKVLHAVDGAHPSEVYALYFTTETCPLELTEPTAIAMTT